MLAQGRQSRSKQADAERVPRILVPAVDYKSFAGLQLAAKRSPTVTRHVRMSKIMEPISHFFYSDRLKLQFWDYGQDGKPALVLVHGGLDHARSWDWVARSLREHYHVYALDLRGHGNSAWAPGAMYSVAEHVLDLSALLDIINEFPIRLVGHSLGGIVVLHYNAAQ